MRASAAEFRHRFIIISLIFFAGFMLYFVDHVNVVEAIAGTTRSAHRAKILFAFAAVLLVGAAAIRTWAAAYLHAGVVHDTRLHTDRLVADGPYRFVRNPLYLGNFLLAFGLGALASRIGCAVIILGNCLFVLRLIGREEAELSQQQGTAYSQYVQAVPRLLPALTPRVPPSGRRPQWAQALAGEAFFWMFAFGLAAFAATLQMRWFFGLMITGFVMRGINVILLRRQRAYASSVARNQG